MEWDTTSESLVSFVLLELMWNFVNSPQRPFSWWCVIFVFVSQLRIHLEGSGGWNSGFAERRRFTTWQASHRDRRTIHVPVCQQGVYMYLNYWLQFILECALFSSSRSSLSIFIQSCVHIVGQVWRRHQRGTFRGCQGICPGLFSRQKWASDHAASVWTCCCFHEQIPRRSCTSDHHKCTQVSTP